MGELLEGRDCLFGMNLACTECPIIGVNARGPRSRPPRQQGLTSLSPSQWDETETVSSAPGPSPGPLDPVAAGGWAAGSHSLWEKWTPGCRSVTAAGHVLRNSSDVTDVVNNRKQHLRALKPPGMQSGLGSESELKRWHSWGCPGGSVS